MSMIIRDLVEEDKEEIIQLGSTLHEDYFLGNLDEPNHLLVALENNKVIGFIHFFVVAGCVDVIDIVVAEGYRKQGIGTSLLEEVEKYNPKEIVLEVSKNNAVAIKFYLKNGFTKVGIRKGYYGGVDGITMKKVIG